MFEIFRNGSSQVNRRLMLIELGLSSLAMVIAAIQGYLPSQDWITPQVMKPLAFSLAIVAILLKGSEMFFSKAASMYSQDKEREMRLEAISSAVPETKTITETTNK